MSVLKLTSALWITNFVNFLFSDSTKVHEKKKTNKNKNKKIIHVIFPHVVPFIIFLRLDMIKQGKKKWGKKKKKFKIHAYSHRPGRAVTSEAMPGRYIFISNGNP